MRRRGFTLIVVTALILSGCGLPAGRAGGDDHAFVADLGTPDTVGRPSEAIIEAFADEVEAQTGGTLLIEPQWDAPRANTPDDDVAHAVSSGEVEFAVVPARAWDLLGVESLKMLQLPGLIVSDEAAAAVASDDALAEKLLSGLDDVGVTGLALVPEGVRRLYVLPPHTPEDFTPRGSGIRTIASKASEELFQLVGATATDASGIELDSAVLSGTVSAVDSSWNLLDTIPGPVSAIGDLPLFTKFDVIAVNSEWFAALSEHERAGIRAAARLTQEHIIAEVVPDVEQAEAFCASGGTIGGAAAETAREFAAAREAMERRWRAEPGAPAIIDRMEALVEAAAEPAEIPFCTAEATTPVPPSTAAPERVFPDGIYRMNVSIDELTDAGMSGGDAMNHAGIWTLTFREGTLLMGDMGFDCPGRYVVSGDRVELHLDREGECGGAAGRLLFSARWELDDLTLRFLDLTSGEDGPGADSLIQQLFQERPFSKIG